MRGIIAKAADTRRTYLGVLGLALLFQSLIEVARIPEPAFGATIQFVVLLAVLLFVWRSYGSWFSSRIVFGSSFGLLFTLPAFLFVFELAEFPDSLPLTSALSISNWALLALGFGVLVGARDHARGPRLPLAPSSIVIPKHRLIIGGLISLASIFVVLALIGGWGTWVIAPRDSVVALEGKTYLLLPVIVSLQAAVFWFATSISQGRSPLFPVAWLICVCIAVGIALASRYLVAVVLFEVLATFALLRGRIGWQLCLLATLTAVLLVLGGGAIKRFSTTQEGGNASSTSLSLYLTRQAPGEAMSAYATNYADGVITLARAAAALPRLGDFERGAIILRLAVQPIPSGIRPPVPVNPAVAAAFYSSDRYQAAIPLQAAAYAQFGMLAVVFVFFAMGVALSRLDQYIGSVAESIGIGSLTIVVAAMGQLFQLLRSSLPSGIAYMVLFPLCTAAAIALMVGPKRTWRALVELVPPITGPAQRKLRRSDTSPSDRFRDSIE